MSYDLNPVPASAPAVPAASRSCIIVDDDAALCTALSYSLRRLGFQTVEAGTPAALDAAMGDTAPDLVFVDLGVGGERCLEILREHGYRGPVQLISGRSRDALDAVARIGETLGLAMLQPAPKPFRLGFVRELVASIPPVSH